MQAILPTQVSDAQVQTDVVSRTSEACQTDNPNSIDFQVQAHGERSNMPSSSGLQKAKMNATPSSKTPTRKINPFEDTTFTGRIVSITPYNKRVGTCEILMKVSEHII